MRYTLTVRRRLGIVIQGEALVLQVGVCPRSVRQTSPPREDGILMQLLLWAARDLPFLLTHHARQWSALWCSRSRLPSLHLPLWEMGQSWALVKSEECRG